MRVWEFLVKEEYRGRLVRTLFMNHAVKIAKENDARMLVLETQSYNSSAVDFYLKYGFELIGFNTAAYSNNDIERRKLDWKWSLN